MSSFFRLLPFFLYGIGLICLVQHNPFFWDSVQLASKHAHFFYENGLKWAALPPEIDSGHPPILGYYLAVVWSVFGKSLPAAHWAMLPFVLTTIWMLYRLGLRLGGEKWGLWLLPIVLLDPVFAGQSVLVGPDLILVCCFLLATEGLLGRNRWFVSLGILGLCIISTRGMMTAGALFVWRFLIQSPNWRAIILILKGLAPKKAFYQFVWDLVVFLPGFLAAFTFLYWHQVTAGWTGFHPDSPWSPAFQRVDTPGLFRNILIFGWRWLDFGRVAVWLIFIGLYWQYLRKKSPGPSRDMLLLLLCLLVFLSPSALLYKNLSAHRYLLPAFLSLHLLVFQWIAHIPKQRFRKTILFAILITVLSSGNFWIYPRGISMDWDSTLAHLPYHRLRQDALVFLEQNNVDFQTVGSAFPNLNTGENLLLDGDTRQFSELDFKRNAYIFASNIFNDFSEADYVLLHRDWSLVYRSGYAGVWIEIYRR